jgi:hypothetical protein
MGLHPTAARGPAKTPDPAGLTTAQKVIGLCLLLFYFAMIGVTLATLPYAASVQGQSLFERMD